MKYTLVLVSLVGTSLAELRKLTYVESTKTQSVRLYGNVKEYAYWFADLLVGTPPQRTSVIVDTGSSVAAFPCTHCVSCGDHIDPAFNFTASSSAEWETCGTRCPGNCVNNHCSYQVSYSEGSSISGSWFSDLVQLGDLVESNIPTRSQLGCHSTETKLFKSQSVNGILGLAPHRLGSFPTVLGSLFVDPLINKNVFSLCLNGEGGELIVGGFTDFHLPLDLQSAGSTIAWVPMEVSNFYMVELSSISILAPAGADSSSVEIASGIIATISVNETIKSSGANAVIDSGTTLVYLPKDLYEAVYEGVVGWVNKHEMSGKHMESVPSATSACWKTKDLGNESIGEFVDELIATVFPVIRFTLGEARDSYNDGRQQLAWDPKDYTYTLSNYGLICLAFSPTPNGEIILGAAWLVNRLSVFDLTQKLFGVANTNMCPSYTDRPEHGMVEEVIGRDTTTTPRPEQTSSTTVFVQVTTEPKSSTESVSTTTTTTTSEPITEETSAVLDDHLNTPFTESPRPVEDAQSISHSQNSTEDSLQVWAVVCLVAVTLGVVSSVAWFWHRKWRYTLFTDEIQTRDVEVGATQQVVAVGTE